MSNRNRIIAASVGLLVLASALLLTGRLPAGQDDTKAETAKIKTLLAEQVDLHKQIVDLLTIQFKQGRLDFVTLAGAQRAALTPSLQLNNTPERRMGLLKEEEEIVKIVKEIADARIRAGQKDPVPALQAGASVLEVQVEILRAAAAQEAKQQPKEASAWAATIKKLLDEQVDLHRRIMGLLAIQFKEGKVHFAEVAGAQRLALHASLDKSNPPEKKMNLLKEHEKTVKALKEFTDARWMAGSGQVTSKYQAEALLLEIQVEILRAAAAQESPQQPKETAAKAMAIKKLVDEQVDLHRENMKLLTIIFKVGKVEFAMVARAQRDALNASLDVINAPEKKIGLLKEHENTVKALKEIADSFFKSGHRNGVEAHQADALLLEIQVEILRAAAAQESPQQPKETAAKATAIKKLVDEQVDLHRKNMNLLTILFKEGKVEFAMVARAQRDALNASLDVSNAPENKVGLLKEYEKTMRALKEVAEARFKRGGHAIDALQAGALLLEVQVEILRAELEAQTRK